MHARHWVLECWCACIHTHSSSGMHALAWSRSLNGRFKHGLRCGLNRHYMLNDRGHGEPREAVEPPQHSR